MSGYKEAKEAPQTLLSESIRYLMPETSFLRIPVLATFEAVEHGTQLPIARSLVFFETVRSACQICYASCEASTAPDREYAPTEEAVGAFQAWVLLPAF
jgi:hypothetical protein